MTSESRASLQLEFASGSQHVLSSDSRMLRLFHSEGGTTDGSYAMYGPADAGTPERVDAVLKLLKVRAPSEERGSQVNLVTQEGRGSQVTQEVGGNRLTQEGGAALLNGPGEGRGVGTLGWPTQVEGGGGGTLGWPRWRGEGGTLEWPRWRKGGGAFLGAPGGVTGT